MEIDNSAANEFRTCPYFYKEGRVTEEIGLEQVPHFGEVAPLAVGKRLHELLEEYYSDLQGTPIIPYPESENAALETESEIIISAYRAKYPREDFEIVDVERPFRVELPTFCPLCYHQVLMEPGMVSVWCTVCNKLVFPGRHVYTGKIDVVFRIPGLEGLDIMDHKSEKRRSNSNRPQKWAARDQASLYLWAARAIYKPEKINRFHVNVLKRPSDKLQEPPIFPERQVLERTQEQIEIAVRDLVVIADTIERYKEIFKDGVWPSNREECDSGWGQCPFYLPHTYGWSQSIRDEKYQLRTPYLKLGDVPIIQP